MKRLIGSEMSTAHQPDGAAVQKQMEQAEEEAKEAAVALKWAREHLESAEKREKAARETVERVRSQYRRVLNLDQMNAPLPRTGFDEPGSVSPQPVGSAPPVGFREHMGRAALGVVRGHRISLDNGTEQTIFYVVSTRQNEVKMKGKLALVGIHLEKDVKMEAGKSEKNHLPPGLRRELPVSDESIYLTVLTQIDKLTQSGGFAIHTKDRLINTSAILEYTISPHHLAQQVGIIDQM